MNVLRAKRSKKIILGAVTAGVAAIGIAATLPAHADTTILVGGVSPQREEAEGLMTKQCVDMGGSLDRSSITERQDEFGDYILEGNCKVDGPDSPHF